MAKKLKIKICGITDEKSLKKAFELKVNYVGLVFFSSSPRSISICKAKKLLKIKNYKTDIVALTVNASDTFLDDIVNNLKPDYIQLHGSESPSRCIEVKKKYSVKIIRALEVENAKILQEQIKQFKSSVDEFILDAPKSYLPGGNGIKFDWKILKNNKIDLDWLIAGGLNITNLQKALQLTNANGVDISSGVEIRKGEKSPKLIEDFVLKCRSIEKGYINEN